MHTFNSFLSRLFFIVVTLMVAIPDQGAAQQGSRTVPRRVLAEEYAGTWCPPCVENARVTQELLEKYKGAVIPVSIHMTTSKDAMAIPEGETVFWLFQDGVSVPRGVFDRVRGNVDMRMKAPAVAEVKIDHHYSPVTREVTATVEAMFVAQPAPREIRMSLYVVEDSVTGTGNSYDQSNGENDDPQSPYYQLGSKIKGYAHRFVLRAIPSTAEGTAGVIPALRDLDKVYSHTYTYTLPATFNQDRVRLVAFLFHAPQEDSPQNAPVLNATDALLITPTSSAPPLPPAAFDAVVMPMPLSDHGSLRLALPEPGDVTIELRDLMGQRQFHLATERMESGDHLIPIDAANLPAGPYTLLVHIDGRTISRKVIVAR